MKNKKISTLMLLSLFSFAFAQAQGIGSSLGLYVFPANNQSAATQEADETACFTISKSQIHLPPLFCGVGIVDICIGNT